MARSDEFWSQLEETAKGWPEQFRAEGLAEGIAAQRASLREQAALRFGASAERLDPLLDGVDSSSRLIEIGRWLMVDTIDELVAKIETAAGDHIH